MKRADPKDYTLDKCDVILRECQEGLARLFLISQDMPVHNWMDSRESKAKTKATCA